MAIISVEQARQYAANAGFTGLALDIIVAIAQAESGLNPAIDHENSDGTIDRGILQINSFWHPEVSDLQAHNPQDAFDAAFTISKQGTDFSQWSTFKSQAYLHTQAWAKYHNADGDPQPTPQSHKWSLDDSKRVWPWLFPMILDFNDPHVNHYKPPDENGTDFGLTLHTEITSLSLGKVLTTGWFGGGGVVCVQSVISGVQAVWYYQHLDIISVLPGDTVHVGDQIGLSGGQLSGGVHPVTCCSTGPHVEVGINPPAGNGDNGKKLWVNLGPNVDPWPYLVDLVNHGPSARDLVGGINAGVAPVNAPNPNAMAQVMVTLDTSVTGTGPVADSFYSIEQAINNAMTMKAFRMTGSQIANPVANVPVLGGIVNIAQTPFNAADSVQSVLSGVIDWIGNNTYPVLIRTMFVLAGLTILAAFIFNFLKSGVIAVSENQLAQAAATGGA